MKKISILLLSLAFLVTDVNAQSWAVSSSGTCLYDRNGNVISGSCQTNAACTYVATGRTRQSSYQGCAINVVVCWWPSTIYYTENEYQLQCPLDDYLPILLICCGITGVVVLRKKQFSNLKGI